jgi:hypothetical protein
MIMFEGNKTRPFLIIRYALYLYFLLELSLRSISKALEAFANYSYVAIWYWIKQLSPKYFFPKREE